MRKSAKSKKSKRVCLLGGCPTVVDFKEWPSVANFLENFLKKFLKEKDKECTFTSMARFVNNDSYSSKFFIFVDANSRDTFTSNLYKEEYFLIIK